MDFDNVKSVAIPEGTAVQIYDGSYVIYEPNPITGTTPLNFCAEGRPLVKCSVAGKTVQNGTPTPTSPIPVQGVGEMTANLYDINAHDTTNGYINNAHLKSDGNAASWSSGEITEYIPISAGVTYTFNGIGSYNAPSYAIYNASKELISARSYNGASKITFTATSDAAFMRFSHVKTYHNAMLNIGSTALPYEPYGYKIQITSNGAAAATLYTDKPLYGIGTNLDYLQRLADGSGVEHRAWGVLTLTGNENYEKYSYSGTDGVRVLNILPVMYSRAQGYCNIYPVSTAAGSVHCIWIGSGGIGDRSLYFISILGDMGLTSAEEFKSYIAAQYAAGTPVTVWYALATPTDTPVTLPAIGTAEGYNTLTVGTTIQPSQVSVKVLGGEYPELENVFLDANDVIFTTADGVPFGFEEV